MRFSHTTETIETSGMIMCLDPYNKKSYSPANNYLSDIGGGLNHAYYSGGATYISDAGGSISLDGVDDHLVINNSSSLQFGETFTVSLWFKSNNLNARYGLFSTRRSNATGCWQLEVGTANNSSNTLAVTGPGTWISQAPANSVSNNTWTFATYVKESNQSTGKIYVNGVLMGVFLETPGFSILNNQDVKVIGEGTGQAQRFPGIIGAVYLYNTALSAATVLSNFNASKARYGI